MKNLVLKCQNVNYRREVGWDNYKAMGISVAVVWDLDDDRWYVFTGMPHVEGTNPLRALPQLLDGNNIIGHNVAELDIPLVREVIGPFEPGMVSDFWQVIHRLNGRKVGLAYLVDNAGIGLTPSSSKDVPRLWQMGEYDRVIELTKEIVLATGLLYRLARERGVVVPDPYNGGLGIALFVEGDELKAGLVRVHG